MLFYVASVLTIASGFTLFSLGIFGLLGPEHIKTELFVLTRLLQPMGFDPVIDQLYLGVLAVLGFWLTLGVYVRIPAAIALGLIIGKLLLVSEILGVNGVLAVSLSLLAFAVLLRIITNTLHEKHDRITPYVFKFW